MQQQDAVGLATFDDQIRAYAPPSGNSASLKPLLHIMENADPHQKTDTGPIFHELAERLTKRGVIVIISDMFDNIESMMAGLKHFRHRRHDVIVLHVLDQAEMEFPFQRPTLFKGLEQFPEVLADPRSLRRAYLQEFNKFLQELQKGMPRSFDGLSPDAHPHAVGCGAGQFPDVADAQAEVTPP